MSFATKTHYEIGFEKDDITYIAGQQSKLNYLQIKTLILDILNQTLDDTILELEIWIDSKVAKRTGKLREDLKLELKSSFVRNTLLKLKLGTHVTYAEFVNQMTMSTVRHVGELGYAYYGGHHGPIILNDPRAIGFFWNKLLEYAKERLEINFVKAKALYLGNVGKAGRMIKKKFTWSAK